VATFTSVPSTNTSQPALVSSAIPFAAACKAGAGFPPPPVEQTDKVCRAKIPYTTVKIPEGATFTPIDPALKCNKEATRDGYTLISCTGKQLFSYDLKVCKPPPLSDADLAQCPADATFDPLNACCAAVPPQDAGCTIFKVDIRACQ
jgi:hypothetical protein